MDSGLETIVEIAVGTVVKIDKVGMLIGSVRGTINTYLFGSVYGVVNNREYAFTYSWGYDHPCIPKRGQVQCKGNKGQLPDYRKSGNDRNILVPNLYAFMHMPTHITTKRIHRILMNYSVFQKNRYSLNNRL